MFCGVETHQGVTELVEARYIHHSNSELCANETRLHSNCLTLNCVRHFCPAQNCATSSFRRRHFSHPMFLQRGWPGKRAVSSPLLSSRQMKCSSRRAALIQGVNPPLPHYWGSGALNTPGSKGEKIVVPTWLCLQFHGQEMPWMWDLHPWSTLPPAQLSPLVSSHFHLLWKTPTQEYPSTWWTAALVD